MAIKEASNELYKSLRHTDGFVGTDVVSHDDTSYIVVYLERKTKELLQKIPPRYKGNTVKVELSAPFFGL
jgi:hypothetical protein